jgi:hypothetical protein
MKEELRRNGITVTTALHGQIFCIPQIPGFYARYFDNIEQAYNHYKPYFTKP